MLTNILLILAAVVIIAIMKSIVIVKQGYEYTVENFGRYVRTLRPGFHILIPVIEKVGAKVSRM